MTRRSKAGGLVPLEKAARAKVGATPRLPALNPQATRQSDIGRKFKALVSGRPRPMPRPENAFGSNPSKYQADDEKEE
jgi:hypothetical protein